MDVFMSILGFIVNNIFSQAAILIGIFALVGLIIQKKSLSDCVSGAFKTIMGMLILGAGCGVIIGSLEHFNAWFSAAVGSDGVVASMETMYAVTMGAGALARDITLAYAGIYVVNIILARITPFKYIFLNGEAPLYFSMVGVLFGEGVFGMGSAPAVIMSMLIGGAFTVLLPAAAQPIMRKITGGNEIAYAHTSTLGCVFTGLISKLVGDPENSTEDIKISPKLSFLSDTYLAIGTIMIPLYIVIAVLAGRDVVAESAGSMNYIMFAIIQGITFCVGIYILLSGVSLLISELVPAFSGIAEKVVPGAIPALDCPVIYTYAPNAVVFGFIFTTIGSFIGMLIWPLFGLPVVIPGGLACFFAGGASAVFANATGGRRGTIIACTLHGLLLSFLAALIAPYISTIVMEGLPSLTAYTLSESDTPILGLLYQFIVGPIASLFH